MPDGPACGEPAEDRDSLYAGIAGLARCLPRSEHLLTVGSLDDAGFIVPHTLPYSTRDVEPVTYTWCHGPAGTSLLFAALAAAGVAAAGGLGGDLAAAASWTPGWPRPWLTVPTSGGPSRPGCAPCTPATCCCPARPNAGLGPAGGSGLAAESAGRVMGGC